MTKFRQARELLPVPSDALSACITSTHCARFHVLHTTQHAYILRRPAEAAIVVVATTSVFKREGMDQRTQICQHGGAGDLPVDIKIHPVIQLAFIDTWVCVDRH